MDMKAQTIVAAAIAASLVLGGCATAPKVDTIRIGDNNLNCTQLLAEVRELEGLRGDAKSDSDKSMMLLYGTGAAVVLAPFTAGLSLLAMGGGTVAGMSAVDKSASAAHAHARAQHLTAMFNQKGCKLPDGG